MPEFSKVSADPLFAISRAILFRMDPEKAHDFALSLLRRPFVQKFARRNYSVEASAAECFGLSFNNRIGLAAGLDKNGDYIDALGALGFGHIEVGTVTPRPQTGNPRPRIFRLTQHQALINRLGFNNKGVDHLVNQIQNKTYTGKLGINIGKNATTPLEKAHEDYLECLEKVFPLADYITVNISSPNTLGLRDLQHGEQLNSLLGAIQNSCAKLASRHQCKVPLLVKIAPDLSDAALDSFCETARDHEVDGIIVSNTSNQRETVSGHPLAEQTGGLSGRAILALSNDRLAATASRLDDSIALIGVGGVNCGNDAIDKLRLGATLVQLYSGLIYQGPALVSDCINATNTSKA
ncbi:MAG: quinone-dependent dihydroorotate dehydrogenase [Granulosicoccus sp.]